MLEVNHKPILFQILHDVILMCCLKLQISNALHDGGAAPPSEPSTNFAANSYSICNCRRWKRLCQDELPLMIAANQVKKSIFQTNFVDRETERPAICPSDFPSLVYSKVDKGDENTVRYSTFNCYAFKQ